MTIKEFVKEKINKVLNEIEKETLVKIKKLREEFEKEKEEIKEKKIKEAENFLKIEKAKRIAEAKIKALNEILKSRDDIYERLLKFLKEDIEKKRREGTYKKIFEELFKEALEDYGEKEGRVIISPKDVEYLKEIMQDLNFEIKTDDSIFAGLIIERKDGKIRVLNTLESRLKKAEPYLMERLFIEVFKI